MIIEFELQGIKCLHKGIFDTCGFWVSYDQHAEFVDTFEDSSENNIHGRVLKSTEKIISGYKLFSHFSFSFYHEDKTIVDLVYARLISVLRGSNNVEIDGIGYFRKLNK